MATVKRWYKILDMLVANPGMTLEELQKDLNISLQTLLKSLEQLNDLLDEDIHLYQKDNKLYLEVYDYARLEQILAGSLRKEMDFNSSSKRMAYLIRRLSKSSTPLLIDDLADDIGVSRGTINKDLKKVKTLSNTYHVDIIGRPNRGIEIKGDEVNLRLLYIHQVYGYFESDRLTNETKLFLKDLFTSYRIPLKIQELMVNIIAIIVARVSKGKVLKNPITYYQNALAKDEMIQELVEHIEKHYDITLNQYERDFLSFPLNTQYIDGLNYKTEFNSELCLLYDNMIQNIRDKILIQFDSNQLFEEIKTHLKFLINRLIFHVQNKDIFHGDIRTKYPLSFEMARVAMEKLEQDFGYTIELSEISYLALYFEMILRHSEGFITPPQKKVAIVCTTGRGTAMMIYRRLEQILGNGVKIEQFSEEEFNPEVHDDYFAIFTTVPLKFGSLKSPVIQITNLFDDKWLQAEWQKVTHYHKRHLNQTELDFMRLTKKDTYEDYLIAMSNQLVTRKLVDEGFINRILEREAKQSTIFHNMIAFPHTINQRGTKIILMLGVLDIPYKNEGRQTDLIFLVAIPKTIEKEMESELLELYDLIFSVASDNTLKEKIRHLKTEEEFLETVRNGGLF
ncbi:BglG family transcription antiterminator [Streptococcus sp. CSL10205-OR2]|uniref:BglG family transcription antiterminator n=1 Tax=Streptococcus sp. CSL10205-OR2 TaxID=2980558 RepID=UPI0021D970FC|nr:PRD domain-containing protein [Streptococcus sp. CSL10205-OR2]MCU9533386.1 PRD domain-containing protein [Streptococcus sp. CSL10205-OR2]